MDTDRIKLLNVDGQITKDGFLAWCEECGACLAGTADVETLATDTAESWWATTEEWTYLAWVCDKTAMGHTAKRAARCAANDAAQTLRYSDEGIADAYREHMEWGTVQAAILLTPEWADLTWPALVADIGPREGVLSTQGERVIHVADDSRMDSGTSSFLFAFGAYGNAYVLAFGTLDNALDDAAEVLKKVAPGAFCDDQVTEAYDAALAEAKAEGKDVEDEDVQQDAMCAAEVDTTHTDSGYLLSYEWSIVGENMTQDELLAFAGGK